VLTDSFIARDASYDLIVTVWRHVHPEADAVAEAAASKSMMHGRVAGDEGGKDVRRVQGPDFDRVRDDFGRRALFDGCRS
jgi:hypothetical protein